MPPAELVVPALITIFSFVTLWIWMGMRADRQKKESVGPKRAALDAVEQRLTRLEVAVDDMAAALTQVAEGQQFVTKLLAERAPDRVALPVAPGGDA
jgi:hypothetical protein